MRKYIHEMGQPGPKVKQYRSDVYLSESLASLGIMEDPETFRASQQSIVLRDLKGALNWSPIMPRKVRLFGQSFFCWWPRNKFRELVFVLSAACFRRQILADFSCLIGNFFGKFEAVFWIGFFVRLFIALSGGHYFLGYFIPLLIFGQHQYGNKMETAILEAPPPTPLKNSCFNFVAILLRNVLKRIKN